MSAAEQAQRVEQARLELSQDFQAVYNSPSGRRVIDYILNTLCQDRRPAVMRVGEGPVVYPAPGDAMYLLALSDMSKNIKNILDYDFTQRQQRAVVHHRRPAPQPYRGTDE